MIAIVMSMHAVHRVHRELADQQPEDAAAVRNHQQVRSVGPFVYTEEQEEGSR
jgi:hypothetical protein